MRSDDYEDRLVAEGVNLRAAREQHTLARRTSASGGVDWVALLGGGLLLGYGLSRRDMTGLLLAGAGGGLLVGGLAGKGPASGSTPRVPEGQRSIRVEQVVTIARPPDEVYAAWREIERLPEIMGHLERVTLTGAGRSHWVAKTLLGRTVEWDAEILHDDAGRTIAWRSLEGADVPNVGAVRFSPAPGGRGTELRVRIEYDPPAGVIGVTVARLFGEEPSQQIADDLRRFKAIMEAGESPSVTGQPRGGGRRSAVDTLLHTTRRVVEAADTRHVTSDSLR